MYDVRYPIGRFHVHALGNDFTGEQIQGWIDEIERTPTNLRKAIAGLSEAELDTPYREEGWTVRQVVHHLPDSHMNSYIRFKLALTEDEPKISMFQEQLWANLADCQGPVAPSLNLLEALHIRWVTLMRSMQVEEFERVYVHPTLSKVSLAQTAALYAWHGRHHVAHITSLRAQQRWT